MVQKNIEGNYRMAEKIGEIERGRSGSADNIALDSHMKIYSEDEKRIKLIKDAIKAQEKELVELQKKVKSNYSEDTWIELSNLKKSFEEQINVKGWNLKKLADMTEYYTYQHTEKSILKTDDENAEWITEFVANGGSKAELIQKASSTREKTWAKMTSSKRKKKKKVELEIDGVVMRAHKLEIDGDMDAKKEDTDKKSEDGFDSNRGLT